MPSPLRTLKRSGSREDSAFLGDINMNTLQFTYPLNVKVSEASSPLPEPIVFEIPYNAAETAAEIVSYNVGTTVESVSLALY